MATRTRLALAALCVVTLVVVPLAWIPSANAQTFSVDSTLDEPDRIPGDEACLTVSGVCTLRAAIQEANAAPDFDTITLSSGIYPVSIAGDEEDFSATGDFDIKSDLAIVGAGIDETVIDGQHLDRLFHIVAEVTVDISHMTIQNGRTRRGLLGGGISSGGRRLTLSDVRLSHNEAGFGGALFNVVGRTMTLDRVIVSDNAAGADGGGIENHGILEITDSTLSGNETGRTSVGEGGGAIRSIIGTLTLTRVTVQGNRSWEGGGVYAGGTSFSAVNVTISGNASGSDGGGLFISAGTARLVNTTLASNTAPPGDASGIYIAPGSNVELANTIVANVPASDNCKGSPVISLGHNLETGASCGFTELGDLSNTDPELAPLHDNGGVSPTHALLADSPAIDAGNPAEPGSTSTACATTDQRGLARPKDGDGDGMARCDIGAFELEGAVQEILVVLIDIKPGSRTNPINPKSRGVIPVVILTTDAINATTIDPETVCFGAAENASQRDCTEAHGSGHQEDVNQDGMVDLILHFDTQQTGIVRGDTQACLTGETKSGLAVHGCDAIRVT